jgi:serine protease Do
MMKTYSRYIRKTAVLAALTGVSFGLGTMARGEWRAPQTSGAAAHAAADVTAPAPDAGGSAPATEGHRGLPSFAALVERAAPAVVHVKVVSTVKAAAAGGEFPFGEGSPFGGFRMPMPPPSGRRQGTGSGFVIGKDGVVLTNNHVVENAKEITVRLSDGTELSAKVLGRDPKTDLAVLKVESTHDLPVVRLGDSDVLRVGDWVVAIGNPFGLDNTVTAGIVSAKGRTIGSGPYDQFIQTDAPINPGNSGGPLFNERGEVIGINTAIFSQSGGNVGIGFAIPINLAKELAPQLEENGHVTRAWLGVSIQQLTPELAESLGVDDTHGALVAGVTPNGPAAKAGIKSGDIITSFNDKPVGEHSGLPSLVAGSKIGERVPVQVLRDGKRKTMEVTLAKLADDEGVETTTPSKGKWGLMLRELTPEERAQRDLADGQGVLVAGVAPDSPAEEAGLHSGDVVLQVNRTPVGSVDALRAAVAKVADGKHLLLLVRPADGTDRFAALAPR